MLSLYIILLASIICIGALSPELKRKNVVRGDASLRHHNPIIKCANQTRCITPIVQAKKIFKIYFCKHINYGVRFYYLAREGLLLHPNVQLVASQAEADFVVYLPVSADWDKSECHDIQYMNKTIILDEGDYPQLFEPSQANEIQELFPALRALKKYYFLYFKRSCVKRKAGLFMSYMSYFNTHQDIFPMTYTVMESYVNPMFSLMNERDYELVCTLRGSKQDPARLRVQQWVAEYGASRNLKKFIAGQVNHASRTTIDENYFTSLHHAQIIVTCNPSHWEGDFRFMETMASGALVFVDIMHTPRINPLVNHKHVVYYDNNNKTAFFDLLDYYRDHTFISRKVAIDGYVHAMQYHRAVNLIDYVLNTAVIRLENLRVKDTAATPLLSQVGNYSHMHNGYEMRHEIFRSMLQA